MFAIAALVLAGSAPVAAADPSVPDAQREATIDAEAEAGVQAYLSRDWTAARFHFEQAHQLRPSARTLRALGLTAQQQHRYAEAAALFARALRSAEQPLTPAMRAELQAASAHVDARIARFRVVAPPGVVLQVDGKPPTFDRADLLVDAGRHELTIETPDAVRATRVLEASAGQRTELRLSRDAEPPARAPSEEGPHAPTPAVTAQTAEWTTRDKLALGAAVAGGAAFAVGATFGLLALLEDDASRGDCDRNTCGPSGLEHRDTAFDHANVATIGFIAAGALLATSLTLHLTDSSERPNAGTSVSIHASGSSHRAALGLHGTF